MSTQLALDLPPLVAPLVPKHATIGERFAAFHEANPHVADALETLARQWFARRQKVGMKALVEQLRWQSGIQTEGDEYRINNDFTAMYSRLLITRNPEWADRIETRTLRTA